MNGCRVATSLALGLLLCACSATLGRSDDPDPGPEVDVEPDETPAETSMGEEREYAAEPRLRVVVILPATVPSYPLEIGEEWFNPHDPDGGILVGVRVTNTAEEAVSIDGAQLHIETRGLRPANCQPSRGVLMPSGPPQLQPGESHTFRYQVQCPDMRRPGERTIAAFIHFGEPDDFEYPHPDTFDRAQHLAGTATTEVVEPE